MDKEQRLRSGYRQIVEGNEDDLETSFIVRVSGQEAELTRGQQHPWDNEQGTGNDETWETWPMKLDTLKRLLQQAQIVIQQSEAFEKSHPIEPASATANMFFIDGEPFRTDEEI